MRHLFSLFLIVLLVGFTGCSAADELRDRVEREVVDRVDRGADDAISGTADATEEAIRGTIRCLAGDEECIEEGRQSGQEVIVVDEQGDEVREEQPPAEALVEEDAGSSEVASRPGEGAWANYDFVPGNRILFYEDFSEAIVGRFPQRLDFKGGMMEVVEWEDRKMLRSTDRGSHFRVQLPEQLPTRFTIEFDAHIDGYLSSNALRVFTNETANRNNQFYFALERLNAGIYGPTESASTAESGNRGRSAYRDGVVHVRIAVDGQYAMMYINEQRVGNIPNAEFERNDFIDFYLPNTSGGTYIDDIRVAAGGRELMYDKLMADGEIVTQGILFDTGSAQLRPESTPTLQDIAQMLNQHNDLSIRIEGHTDSVGDAEANRRLSEQRARSVREYLVFEEGISSDRLESVGKGEDEPVASNDTAEGRQENRRVVLVRM